MSRLSIASVSMNMPTAKRPEQGIFVRRRLAAMAAHADVRALHAQPWFPLLQSFDRSTTDLEFNVTGQPFLYIPFFLKRFDSWWMRRAIRPVLERWHGESSLDLIDAHFGYPTGVACYHVGRQLGIPTFITLRGVEASQLRHPAVGRQMVDALQGCAGVIAVSESLKAAAVDAGVTPDNICVVPNAVDTNLFQPGCKLEARRSLGLIDSERIVVSVGNLVSVKQHHILVAAFAQLHRQLPDARLVIIGGPQYERDYPHRIRSQVTDLGLANNVTLTGAVSPSSVVRWLRAADIFSLVSAREGSCNAVLEAMACGLPVVVTPVGENSRLVVNGRNGILVSPAEPAELSRCLEVACHKAWDSDDIVATVRGYSWSGVAQSVLQFMRSRLT